MSRDQDLFDPRVKDKIHASNETAEKGLIVIKGKMDGGPAHVQTLQANVENSTTDNNVLTQADKPEGSMKKPNEGNPMSLDKFKRRLVRAVARHIQQKKPEEDMWKELKQEIGCDCTMLWQHMRALTMKKLKRLLPVNDMLASIKKIARFTATDWLLFDLILVHEKINVIGVNDACSPDDESKEEPQCLYDLFELVKEHNVENLVGDDLIEAWIRVTLQYNSRGRQCSPMILQLRWYQLKELTRARFYNFWCSYRGNHRILDRAMKVRPTKLQAAIAKQYKNVITQPYPEWENLIQDRRVILSEEFTMNREAKRKAEKIREENDVDIEVIEPVVETIELEVDSDEDHCRNREQKLNVENNKMIEGHNKDLMDAVENCQVKNTSSKSESEDDVLDIDGLSDVETMHISLQKQEQEKNTEVLAENITELISDTSDDHLLILPKITNVIGNILEPIECSNEHKTNTVICHDHSEDAGTKTIIDSSTHIETIDTKIVKYNSDKKRGLEDTQKQIIVEDNTGAKTEGMYIVKCDPDEERSSKDVRVNKKIDVNTFIKTEDSSTTKCASDEERDLIDPRGKTIIGDNTSIEIKGTLQCDTDEEMDKLLCEKAHSFMNIAITQIKSECEGKTEVSAIKENMNTSVEFLPEDTKSVDSSRNSYNDSDVEINNYLHEKANNYICTKTSQRNLMTIEAVFHENSHKSKNIIINENSNENSKKQEKYDDLDCEEKKLSVKIEKQDDGFDEVEFDDDLIEFVDDGIEFIEETNCDNKINVKKVPLCDSEEKVKDYPKIDLKLLMNPIIYTKKLDVMDVFKFSDYTYVNDKIIIEGAFNESKPVDRLALKDEDIDKFRDLATGGYETDCTQSDNDIIETVTEYANHKVKCTSWLLQKPKNRKYNPIQLCKNPDFNTRLKRLTAGFLSSTRNRVLLKECKPLTIDLHKAFEKKLINGTIYLKSGDFKSASTAVDNVNNDPVSVLPSVIPGQSMVFTTPDTNNVSTVIPIKTDNREDNLPLSTIAKNHIPTERRKIINLPDIDQVRRVNQSLLTAEVTPIRVDHKINNANSCEELAKATVVEPAFVQPIALAPIFQVKSEPLQPDKDIKSNIQTELSKVNYDNIPAKDLMAHKINDQIINLSNQISEVETNELLSVDVEKTLQNRPQIKNKFGKKPKHNMEKPKSTQQINKLTYVPRYTGQLSWSPKYPKNHIADSLLTLDTLSKILFILNENEDDLKDCSCKQKRILKEMHNDDHSYSQIKQSTKDQQADKSESDTTIYKEVIKSASEKDVMGAKSKGYNRSGALRKRINKPRLPSQGKKYTGPYCCWAREKIVSLSKNTCLDIKLSKHRCHFCQCLCCCRLELVTLITWNHSDLRNYKNDKKTASTIVLSDDEDLNKNIQGNQAVVNIVGEKSKNKTSIESCNLKKASDTSNFVNEQSNKVPITIEIPPVAPIIEDKNCTDSSTAAVTNVGIQSKISEEKTSNDGLILPSNEEKDLIRTTKFCKTVVHAAEGHAYNKRLESISSHDKEKQLSADVNSSNFICYTDRNRPLESISNHDKERKNSVTANSAKSVFHTGCNKRLESVSSHSKEKQFPIAVNSANKDTSPKQVERTLFLNSSQIFSQPSRTPIYLGKNKILLCSLKQPHVIAKPINPYLPVLPYGVNFVMLPNGELTLSIENGTQLDSEQLSTLPAIMSIVQEQFLKSDVLNKIDENSSIPEETDSVKIIAECNKKDQINIKSVEHSDNQTKLERYAPNDCSIVSVKDTLSHGKNIETESVQSSLNHIDGDGSFVMNNETENKKHISEQIEPVNAQPRCEKLMEEHQVTETQTEITDPKQDVENRENLSPSTEPSIPSVKPCEPHGDENKNVNSRKTILSDLMEMSGISAEDTAVAADVTDYSSNTLLPPTIIPVTTRIDGSGVNIINLATNSSAAEKITIGGPYSNLLSFEPTTPTNHLLNCIAQIRPELNAVTTFAELKYIYENDGTFHKLDVNTGIISEIKVLIKKNPKTQSSSMPNAFIDLTDDTADSENEVTCAEFEDLPRDKQGNAEVKPIKLFKSIHCSILKHTGKSILKDKEVAYPKKIIRINKHRRKKLLNVGNKYMLVDIDKKNESMKTKDLPLDSSYDSSDEEPLAKKSKRIKAVVDIDEVSPLFLDPPEPHESVPHDIVGVIDVPDVSGECDDAIDLDINTMEIEGVNPELHPVAFEEGSDSDEDMCILGV